LIGSQCSFSTIFWWISVIFAIPALIAILCYCIFEGTFGTDVFITKKNHLAAHDSTFLKLILIEKLVIGLATTYPLRDPDYRILIYILELALAGLTVLVLIQRRPIFSISALYHAIRMHLMWLIANFLLVALAYLPETPTYIYSTLVLASLGMRAAWNRLGFKLRTSTHKRPKASDPDAVLEICAYLDYFREDIANISRSEDNEYKVSKDVKLFLVDLIAILSSHGFNSCMVDRLG